MYLQNRVDDDIVLWLKGFYLDQKFFAQQVKKMRPQVDVLQVVISSYQSLPL